MSTALIIGATGICGSAIVQHLLASSEWKAVITMSRSQQPTPHEKLSHQIIDLQSDTDTMSKTFEGLPKVDFVFFCAYLADADSATAYKINVAMLQNFLDALRHSGSIKSVQRVILVNGLKQYGVHLGQPRNPMHETDPRLDRNGWPPNFYYGQQDVLIKAAEADQNRWSWVVTHPQDVIGVAKGNFMNMMTALGLYASVSSALPGAEMVFPGAKSCYLSFNSWTSAKLHAEFCVWAAKTPEAGNNMFNVVNGDVESWQHLWPRLVERYGGKIPPVMFPTDVKDQYKDFEAFHVVAPFPPAIVLHEERIGLKGEFKYSEVHQVIDTVKWSQRPEVKQQWEDVRDRFDLDPSTWEQATWRFLTFLLSREFSCVVSMSKARRMGWVGYKDTWDAIEETLDELEKQKILPPASKIRHSGAMQREQRL